MAILNANDANTKALQIRTQAGNLLIVLNHLEALANTWDRLDLGNTNDSGMIEDDLTGVNEGITRTALAAVIGTTLDAFNSLLAAGHGTNLESIAYYPDE